MEAPEERFSPPPMPTSSLSNAASAAASHMRDEPEDDHEDHARAAAEEASATTFGADAAANANPGAGVAGKRALVQYDYEKAEDNEIELREGEYVENIEMVDEDWWMGQNSQGETGLFPSNYVEIVEDDDAAAGGAAAPPPPAPARDEPAAAPAPSASAAAGGQTATAQYDYDAAEDNELSFPDGAKITDVVSLNHFLDPNQRDDANEIKTGIPRRGLVVWTLQRPTRSFPCQLRRAGPVDLRARFVVAVAYYYEKTVVGMVDISAAKFLLLCLAKKRNTTDFFPSFFFDVSFDCCDMMMVMIILG